MKGTEAFGERWHEQDSLQTEDAEALIEGGSQGAQESAIQREGAVKEMGSMAHANHVPFGSRHQPCLQLSAPSNVRRSASQRRRIVGSDVAKNRKDPSLIHRDPLCSRGFDTSWLFSARQAIDISDRRI